MNRQDIINALEIKGYRAEARDISKNNVMLEAIQIMAIERINPIIYTASIIEDAERSGATVEQVADVIIDAYTAGKSR